MSAGMPDVRHSSLSSSWPLEGWSPLGVLSANIFVQLLLILLALGARHVVAAPQSPCRDSYTSVPAIGEAVLSCSHSSYQAAMVDHGGRTYLSCVCVLP